ncbi:hypothetical protein [Actinomadura flavalba]|uniref:hypothetical protein n=1 Tax=Actinomadura flavalba TaxID=1120938 RepID=UPI00036226AE|nr:hypothetical protein [Actinomadura flavalba]
MLVAVIVACEIGFWLILLAGLAVRYPLRRPRLGGALLLCVPLVDVVLLTATVLDLRGGGTANFTHGLAAAYLGYSVAFGHSWVKWADARFAHRFADAPAPIKPPKYGRARTRHEWREFAKAAIATALACGVLLTMTVMIDDPSRTEALTGWTGRLGLVLAVWSLWPITHTLWPSKPPANPIGSGSGAHRSDSFASRE